MEDDEGLNRGISLKLKKEGYQVFSAFTIKEAEEFLEDCMAVVCKNLKEVKAYFEDQGADIEGMSLKDLEEASEVFALPDGRYLIVEA